METLSCEFSLIALLHLIYEEIEKALKIEVESLTKLRRLNLSDSEAKSNNFYVTTKIYETRVKDLRRIRTEIEYLLIMRPRI